MNNNNFNVPEYGEDSENSIEESYAVPEYGEDPNGYEEETGAPELYEDPGDQKYAPDYSEHPEVESWGRYFKKSLTRKKPKPKPPAYRMYVDDDGYAYEDPEGRGYRNPDSYTILPGYYNEEKEDKKEGHYIIRQALAYFGGKHSLQGINIDEDWMTFHFKINKTQTRAKYIKITDALKNKGYRGPTFTFTDNQQTAKIKTSIKIGLDILSSCIMETTMSSKTLKAWKLKKPTRNDLITVLMSKFNFEFLPYQNTDGDLIIIVHLVNSGELSNENEDMIDEVGGEVSRGKIEIELTVGEFKKLISRCSCISFEKK